MWNCRVDITTSPGCTKEKQWTKSAKDKIDNHLAWSPHLETQRSYGIYLCLLAGCVMVNHLVKVSCSEYDRNVMINKFFC